MPTINTGWPVTWPATWGAPLVLDGLAASGGSVHYHGDYYLEAKLGAFFDTTGASVSAQTWQVGLAVDSVSVTITRAGTTHALLSFSVVDTDGAELGAVAGFDYPGGTTVIDIPLSSSAFDLDYLRVTNDNYFDPLGIDCTVGDITATAAAGGGATLTSAVGFCNTVFGTPWVPGIATGFCTTAFGTPSLSPTHAVGFCSTAFGTPSIFPMHAVGFCSTAFGTPTGVQRWRAFSLGPTTVFGTPTTPTDRSFDATGFSTTSIPEPTAVLFSPDGLGRKMFATGFGPTARFGTSAAALAQSGQVTGFTPTAFGTPRAVRTGHASGIASTAFGMPTLKETHAAHGFQATAFGTPKLILTTHATGMPPRARFGIPRQWAQHQGYGFCSTRFGQPRGLNQHRYHASGFCSTRLGTPMMHEVHRATPLYSATVFGTPLLRRSPECAKDIVGRAVAIRPAAKFGTPTMRRS